MELTNDPSRPLGRGELDHAAAAGAASLASLASGLKAALGARVHLLELEAQRAAGSVAKMVGFAVAAALLAVTAWLIVAGGMTYAAMLAGMPWWLGMLLVISLHLLGAWLLVNRIKAQLGQVSFAASRRSLMPTTTLAGNTDGSL